VRGWNQRDKSHNFRAERKFSEITKRFPAIRFPAGLSNLSLGLLNVALTVVGTVSTIFGIYCWWRAGDYGRAFDSAYNMGFGGSGLGQISRMADSATTWGVFWFFVAIVAFIINLIWIIRDLLRNDTSDDGVPRQ